MSIRQRARTLGESVTVRQVTRDNLIPIEGSGGLSGGPWMDTGGGGVEADWTRQLLRKHLGFVPDARTVIPKEDTTYREDNVIRLTRTHRIVDFDEHVERLYRAWRNNELRGKLEFSSLLATEDWDFTQIVGLQSDARIFVFSEAVAEIVVSEIEAVADRAIRVTLANNGLVPGGDSFVVNVNGRTVAEARSGQLDPGEQVDVEIIFDQAVAGDVRVQAGDLSITYNTGDVPDEPPAGFGDRQVDEDGDGAPTPDGVAETLAGLPPSILLAIVVGGLLVGGAFVLG